MKQKNFAFLFVYSLQGTIFNKLYYGENKYDAFENFKKENKKHVILNIILLAEVE